MTMRSVLEVLAAADKAAAAMKRRRTDGRPAPKVLFVDGALGYDGPAWIPRQARVKHRALQPANPADMARSRAILGEREEEP